MKTNKTITIYHKSFNSDTKLDDWKRQLALKAMIQGGRGASINKGYDKANDISVWIPFVENSIISVEYLKDKILITTKLNEIIKLSKEDIIVCSDTNEEIKIQKDLKIENFNITTLIVNDYCSNEMKHIFLGAK